MSAISRNTFWRRCITLRPPSTAIILPWCSTICTGTQKIRNDIAKTKEKIAEQQKRLRALEAQLAEEENLEIVRMVKAVKMDNKELTAFLKAYASGMISLPEGMLQEGNTENEETEGYEDEA